MGGRTVTQTLVEAVEDRCIRAGDGDELFEGIDHVLRRAVPFDGATWFATDPATLLSVTPTRVDGIDAAHCESFWHREFHVADAMLFRDLARAEEPVASLRAVTDDRPMRSARYREMLVPHGYDDELRAVFKLGASTWGIVALYRSRGRPAFTAEERAAVASVTPTVAAALRRYVAHATPWTATPSSPGVMLVDGAERVVSTNVEAAEWLGEIHPGAWLIDRRVLPRASLDLSSADSLGRQFPPSVVALVARARAVARGHERGPARLRLRSRKGQWLVLHASCLGDPADGTVAVMIEPAKSGEIAPIIVEAYALSPRERDVVRAIARGLSSTEIGAELFLSPHTVRDYVKSVFEKVGVSSRGELVAKLFAEHYSEPLHAGLVHVD